VKNRRTSGSVVMSQAAQVGLAMKRGGREGGGGRDGRPDDETDRANHWQGWNSSPQRPRMASTLGDIPRDARAKSMMSNVVATSDLGAASTPAMTDLVGAAAVEQAATEPPLKKEKEKKEKKEKKRRDKKKPK